MSDFLREHWLALVKPDLSMVDVTENGATFMIAPLERGFGLTLGTAFRRILLSSMRGAAVVGVRIDGIDHQYATVPGMKEDVLDLTLNLKLIAIKSETVVTDKLHQATLRVKGPCIVTAGMINVGSGLTIANPDYVLCHMDRGSELNMVLFIGHGSGYVIAEDHKLEDARGMIPIDAMFEPIKNVSFKVENSRLGARMDLDKLFISIETNGTIKPDIALGVAARILQEQTKMFATFSDEGREQIEEKRELPFEDWRLLLKVDTLDLSVRAQNCLKNANIVYIGDLVTKNESGLMSEPNFGRKSLNEVKDVLARMKLRLGMEVPGWPPDEDVGTLIKEYHKADDDFVL